MRAGAFDQALLTRFARFVERERAALADQNARTVRRARKSLPFQLLVARIAELGDRRVAAQLATGRRAATESTARIVRDHHVVLADQNLSAVTRARLERLVATRIVRLRDRGVTRRAPIRVDAAPGAAARHDSIQPAVTREHAVLGAAGRRALVVGTARVAGFVAAEVAAGSLLARRAAARALARRLDEMTGLAG